MVPHIVYTPSALTRQVSQDECPSCTTMMQEWTKYNRESAILRIRITRGIFYAFVGLLELDQNSRATLRNDAMTVGGTAAATLYFSVVAWFMIGCGTAYTLLELC
jgi:hypothetical protein